MSAPIHCHTRFPCQELLEVHLGYHQLDLAVISNVKFSSLEYNSKNKLIVCCSNSSKDYRRKRNSDFSRQDRQGFSSHRIGDDYEHLEESGTLMSNNGQAPSSFWNQNSEATSPPGPMEREIVELFRKVQTQIRDKKATCEKKEVDSSPGQNKESGAVDSLLKVLKKHSVQKGKKKRSNARDSIEMKNSSTEQSSTSIADSILLESSKSLLNRPKSSFSRGRQKIKAESEEQEALFPKGRMFDERPGIGATSESCESENDEHEPSKIEAKNLSGMRAIELRALAKGRGIKGFSKLKKNELIELLREVG